MTIWNVKNNSYFVLLGKYHSLYIKNANVVSMQSLQTKLTK